MRSERRLCGRAIRNQAHQSTAAGFVKSKWAPSPSQNWLTDGSATAPADPRPMKAPESLTSPAAARTGGQAEGASLITLSQIMPRGVVSEIAISSSERQRRQWQMTAGVSSAGRLWRAETRVVVQQARLDVRDGSDPERREPPQERFGVRELLPIPIEDVPARADAAVPRTCTPRLGVQTPGEAKRNNCITTAHGISINS